MEYGDYIKYGIIAIVLIAIAYFTIRYFVKRNRRDKVDENSKHKT